MVAEAPCEAQQASACRLYQQGFVSLGRAAELAGLDIVSFKRVLAEQGIARTDPESLDETLEMVHRALQSSDIAKDAGRR